MFRALTCRLTVCGVPLWELYKSVTSAAKAASFLKLDAGINACSTHSQEKVSLKFSLKGFL
jgi:hypothetical protein